MSFARAGRRAGRLNPLLPDQLVWADLHMGHTSARITQRRASVRPRTLVRVFTAPRVTVAKKDDDLW